MNLIYPFGTFSRRLVSSSSSRLPASSWESPAKLPGGFSMLGFCFFAGAPCPLALGLDREKEDKETCGFLPCSLTACCSSQVLAGFFSEPENCLEAAPGRPESGAASRLPWPADPRAGMDRQPGGCRLGLGASPGATGLLHRPKCCRAAAGVLRLCWKSSRG